MATCAICFGAVIAVSACDRVPLPVVPFGPPLPLRVRVDQGFFELGQCDSLQLTMTAVNAEGDTVKADSAHWSSFDTLSAPISRTGLLFGRMASTNDTAYVEVFGGGSVGYTNDSFAIFADCNDVGGVNVCRTCPPSASRRARSSQPVDKARASY
jgi:hypothetical protein